MKPLHKIQQLILILLFFFFSGYNVSAQVTPTTPTTTWQTKTPSEVSLNQTKLDEIKNYLGGRGVIIRHGYQIYSWGDITSKGDIASAAKPFYSHFLFKAIEQGKISSVDTKINTYESCVNNINSSLGNKDKNITFRHLANQISGYQLTDQPGSAFAYNDYQMALFFDTLFTKVYNTSHSNIDNNLLKPLLTSPLQMQDNPTFLAFGTQDRPGRMSISPRDLARFGLLYLRNGNWNGTQILSSQAINTLTTSPVSNSIPRTTGSLSQMCPNQRSIGSTEQPDNQSEHYGSYSYTWWINGLNKNNNRFWPDAPTDTYAALGHTNGKRGMAVIPSLDIVITWNDTNLDTKPASPHPLNTVFKSLKESVVTKPATSSKIIVNPQNPRWLVYNKDSNSDGKLDPFYWAGPGGPEDFLYRGSKNTNGTRNGDQSTIINSIASSGSNSIYMQMIRSHGGDGSNDHNPFINNDPNQGLNQNIINQWDTWITEMENKGIVVLLFLYDDGTDPFNSGSTVTTTEKNIIQGLVNKFKKHSNIIWSIAEEYEDKLSPQRVQNIASEIRLVDDQNHPIAVHQLGNNLTFDFGSDPNIDIFAQQTEATTPETLHQQVLTGINDANGRFNVIMSENYNEGNNDHGRDLRNNDRTTARKRNWASSMAGAYVMVFGTWENNVANPSNDMLKDWGRMRQFFESTNFQEMTPHDELKSSSTQYVLSKPGTSYILYTSNATQALGVTGLTSGQYKLTWFDTVNGTITIQDPVSVGGTTSWPKPNGYSNEVALYLERRSGTNSPTPTPTSKPGDSNGDNLVNGTDYVTWVNNYGKQTTNGASKGDFNNNGITDGQDYVIWINNYDR